jgi:hypothetical protein
MMEQEVILVCDMRDGFVKLYRSGTQARKNFATTMIAHRQRLRYAAILSAAASP